MILLLTAALAGFYHPSDVAGNSAAFRDASERSAASANEAQSRARAFAEALRQFEEGLDLLGPLEPGGQRERLAALEKQYNRDFAVIQGFADALVTDFDGAFQSALDRALEGHSDATLCRAEIPQGPKLPGMRQRTKPNPECTGDDLNATLAAAMDADATLKSDLEAVLGRTWPTFELEPEPVEPVGGEVWIGVSAFFRSGMRDTLRTIDRLDEEERIPFEAAIEQGASKDELRAMADKARAVDEQTRTRRSEAAAPVLARAEVLFSKRSPVAGWCAQPVLLGGCAGTADPDLSGVLLADKKIVRSLQP